MKKISILIISIIYSLSSFAQKVALSSGVSINIAEGTETLDKGQFSTYGTRLFSNSKVALNNIAGTVELTNDKTHFYKTDNVLVILVHGDTPVNENHLSELKKGNDAMHKRLGGLANYTSVIKTINNNHVLIMYDDFENVGYYNVFCWSSNYTHVLTAGLQFDLPDKDKATKILDDILNGVEFTK